ANHLAQSGSAVMQGATERIAAASGSAVTEANTRLRHHQRQAIGSVSQSLIHSSRQAFDRVGQTLSADSEEMVLHLAQDLNLERARRTAEKVQAFLQNQMDAITQVAQEPRIVNADAFVATRLRQLVFQHHVALIGVELLKAN